MSSGSFKNNSTDKIFGYKYLYMKKDLILNNLQGLICHKKQSKLSTKYMPVKQNLPLTL